MGMMSQNIGRSATGNVVKAVLCIRTLPKDEAITYEKKISKEEEEAIEDIVQLNDDLIGRAKETLEGKKGSATFNDIKSKASSNRYIALEVQYNPESIRLETSAGRQLNYSGGGMGTQVQQVLMPAATNLSFELLFDDVNVQDAFMLEGNPITGASTGNVLKAVESAVTGSGYSVQRQMEGLLALLTVPQSKHVIFFWGAMCFRGEVTEVSTTYTMFNKKGKPVRGKLGMSIRQGSNIGDEAAYKYDNKYWDEAIDRSFGSSMGSGFGVSDLSNNLLNLKL